MQTSEELKHRVVVAVGSGKGGVGKTLLAFALARKLTELNQQVILVDMSLGGFYTIASSRINECRLQAVGEDGDKKENIVSRLQLVSGAQLFPCSENNGWHGAKLHKKIRGLDANYVILDLGPGTTAFTTECFLSSDVGVLVTTPDPMAIQNCYNFMNSCLRNAIQTKAQRDPEIKKLLTFLEKRCRDTKMPLKDFLQQFNNGNHRVSSILNEVKRNLKTGIVLNMVQDKADLRSAASLRTYLLDLLGFDTEIWGHINYEKDVAQSIYNKIFEPMRVHSNFQNCLDKIVSILCLCGMTNNKDRWNGNHRQNKIFADNNGQDVICGTRCALWNECRLRRGGYPCRMKPVGQLKLIETERSESLLTAEYAQ